MRFDIYGRYTLEVERQDDGWAVYRPDRGGRRRVFDFVIPSDLPDTEIATYLDDILHELAGLGAEIRRLD
ncbi:MAG: hypothetical protein GKS00_19425 [Alphaproteobacteria bacterium]|nr:hypothetical protein [Alphaproteobacteria bacterium]